MTSEWYLFRCTYVEIISIIWIADGERASAAGRMGPKEGRDIATRG